MDSDLNVGQQTVSDGLMSDHPYFTLACVLNEAFLQAATGKGADRHGKGQRFEDQRMQSISQLLGSERGMAYQVCKKVAEGLDLPTTDRKVAELLGAINYLAGIVIYLRGAERVHVEAHEPITPQPQWFPIPRAEVDSVALQVKERLGVDAIKSIIFGFGVGRLVEIRPPHYPEFIRQCEAALSKTPVPPVAECDQFPGMSDPA